MTIPSRKAPPPPNRGNQQNNESTNNTAAVSRYMPTTNWDDKPFENNKGFDFPGKNKKNPPPRPPPPRPILKKPGSQHSVNLLTNLFGARRSRTPPAKLNYEINPRKVPPKIPPPCSKIGQQNLNQIKSFNNNDTQLIDFDSPPSSPTLTQKSSSDCVSVSSFSSDSNYSSPNNGNTSQAESGFEDDFNVDSLINKDPWDSLDPFSSSMAKTKITQKPVTVGSTSFYAYTSDIQQKPLTQYDPLCNGKSLIEPPPPVTFPTIIRPNIPTKPKIIPNINYKIKENKEETIIIKEEICENDDSPPSPPSPPMPNCPPPPPPPEFFLNDKTIESYGVSLYDFEGTHDEDLSLKMNEKVYLLRKIDDDWYYGRNKRGCVGIFPISYIDVKIPLNETNSCDKSINQKELYTPRSKSVNEMEWIPPQRGYFIRSLYNFNAEVDEDLSLQENELVEVLYKINDEWLFGRIGNRTGQFPANFVEYIPPHLPMKP